MEEGREMGRETYRETDRRFMRTESVTEIANCNLYIASVFPSTFYIY